MDAFTESVTLLLVLLNPFMLSVYLHDMLRTLEPKTIRWILLRSSSTSILVFSAFALTGDAFFRDFLQVRFASFLIFGGSIFLIIGIQFVILGHHAKERLVGGTPEHIAGSITMPFMIGPGTVSASVVAGTRSPAWVAILAIVVAVACTAIGVLLLDALQRRVSKHYEGFVERYTEVVGRISALIIGTVAIDMILRGIDLWRPSE